MARHGDRAGGPFVAALLAWGAGCTRLVGMTAGDASRDGVADAGAPDVTMDAAADVEAGDAGPCPPTLAAGRAVRQDQDVPWDGFIHIRGAFLDRAGRRYAYGLRQYGDTRARLDAVVVRFRADGGLDTGFGDGGAASFGPGGGVVIQVLAMAEDARGRLLVAGDIERPTPGISPGYRLSGWVARLDERGALDPTFGAEGEVEIGEGPGGSAGPMVFYGVAVDGERVVVAGTDHHQFGPSTLGFALALRDDGTPDPGFHGGATYFDLASEGYAAVRVTREGYVLAGNSRAGHLPRALRLRRDGEPDPAFGSAGVAENASFPGLFIRGLAVTRDGVTVAGASSGERVMVLRFDAQGRADPGFGERGAYVSPTGLWNLGYELTPVFTAQCDGRLVMVFHEATLSGRAVRLTADGRDDPSFGGARGVALGSGWNGPAGVAVAPDGAVLALTTPGGSVARSVTWWRLGE